MSLRHTDFLVANGNADQKPASGPQKRKRSGSVSKSLQKRRSAVAERTMEDIRSSFNVSQKRVAVAPTSTSTARTGDSKAKVEQKSAPINLVDDDDYGDTSSIIDLTQVNKPVVTEKKKSSKKTKEPRVSVNDWPGLVEMAAATGIHSVTCVDPGTRNFALARVEFHPRIRVTHVRVLDFDVLAHYYEAKYKVKLKREGAKFTIDAHLVVLQNYIECDIQQENGCFNSSMVLVEEQSMSRDMARVEACVHATVNSMTNAFRLNKANRIPRCQVVSAKSVKSCYRPLFPDLADVDDDEEQRLKKKPRAKPRFGMGDVHGNSAAEQQRLFNKKNAIKYGRLMLAQSRIKDVVPADNLTADDRERVLKAKCDDLYDCLFMALYFGSCYLFHYYKMKTYSDDEQFVVTAAPPQRPHNCYEEIFELCAAISTPVDCMQDLVDKLLKGTGETIDMNKL